MICYYRLFTSGYFWLLYHNLFLVICHWFSLVFFNKLLLIILSYLPLAIFFLFYHELLLAIFITCYYWSFYCTSGMNCAYFDDKNRFFLSFPLCQESHNKINEKIKITISYNIITFLNIID